MKRFLIIISLISFSSIGFAQHKYEKEIRIKEKEVPEHTVSYVDSLKLSRRIKWYKEIGFKKTSFEAKTIHEGKRLSIEFSDNGTFEDFEIEIKPQDIPLDNFKKMSDYLEKEHHKYLLSKVQIQYSGDTKLILSYFRDAASAKGLTVNYEVVISTKENGSFVMFEYLFDNKGAFIQKSQILLKMTDNLEF